MRTMQVSHKEVASAVKLSATTLGRRRQTGRFTQMESDQIIRIARLICLARELMTGDALAAREWLTMPQDILGDEAPRRQSLVLQVLGAVVAGETNFIINPLHEDFDLLRTGPISDFQFDSRLLRSSSSLVAHMIRRAQA